MSETKNLVKQSKSRNSGKKKSNTVSQSKGQLTQEQLESHLWEAAALLRGSIDSGDYKQYIFGLLFYKRLCDVWNEKYEMLLKKFNGDSKRAADPKEHRFHIPLGCMWYEDLRQEAKENGSKTKNLRTIRDSNVDIGVRLQDVFRKFEKHNPKLAGVFQYVDFSNQDRFTDALLDRLLGHFEKVRMRTSDVDSHILGNSYEYLISKFADDAGKKGGEFYTPKEVVRLLVEILQPQEGNSLYDPTCGSGGMLLEAVNFLRRRNKDGSKIFLYGQEKNINTWAICKMALFLQDIDKSYIERGDTLLEPKHLCKEKGVESLRKFDVILANPPFSLRNWGFSVWNSKEGDPFGRTKFGIPPKGYGDYAFIQHMVSSLKPKGKIGVVVPMGVLFRGGKERPIRQKLIEQDLIDAVVGLGPNLFYGASIPAALIFLRKDKEVKMRNKILIVNATKQIKEGIAQSYLTQKHIDTIANVVKNYREEFLFSRIVDKGEIVENGYNLNVIRYVQTEPPPQKIDVQKSLQKLQTIKKELDVEYQNFQSLFGEIVHD
jgi:type I restriction enzyme M protein